MSLTWILCVGLLAAISSAEQEDAPLKILFTEEGSNVILACPSSAPGTKRAWFTGVLNLQTYSTPFANINKLFEQLPSDASPKKVTANDNVELEEASFSLKIINLQLKHSNFWTCVTNSSSGVKFDIVRVQVYGSADGVDVVHIEEGAAVTMYCPTAQPGVIRAWYRGASKTTTHNLLYKQDAAGKVVEEVSSGFNFRVDTNTFVLSIPKVLFDARGYYKCVSQLTDREASSTIFLNVYRSVTVLSVEEFSTSLLYSRVPFAGTWSAHWKHGLIGTLFTGSESVNFASTNRESMKLSQRTFDLIIGDVRITDDTFITCVVTTPNSLVDIVSIYQVQVYTQSSLLGLLDIEFNESMTVTFKCRVDRIYPRLRQGRFSMRFGAITRRPTAVANSDGSWSYVVSFVKTLVADDDGTIVNCTLHPRRGHPAFRVETISVRDKNGQTNSEKTTTSIKSPAPGKTNTEGVGTTTTLLNNPGKRTGLPLPGSVSGAGGTKSIAIIGGVVSGVVVVIVAILVCVMWLRRRRTVKDGVQRTDSFASKTSSDQI